MYERRRPLTSRPRRPRAASCAASGTESEPFRPTGDRVVVRDVPLGERVTGFARAATRLGLVLKDTDDERRSQRECIVLAVGPGFETPAGARVPAGVVPGDRVLVDVAAVRHEAATIEPWGEVRIVRIWDLSAVIEEGAVTE